MVVEVDAARVLAHRAIGGIRDDLLDVQDLLEAIGFRLDQAVFSHVQGGQLLFAKPGDELTLLSLFGRIGGIEQDHHFDARAGFVDQLVDDVVAVEIISL